MWTLSGPSDEAIALLEADGGPLSSGERVVLLSAWAFWNSTEAATLADVVYRLDRRNLRTVATLMLAMDGGSSAIDDWILVTEDHQASDLPSRRRPSSRGQLPLPCEWRWQWVFPAARHYRDRITGELHRHHVHETVIQRAVRAAGARAFVAAPQPSLLFPVPFRALSIASNPHHGHPRPKPGRPGT